MPDRRTPERAPAGGPERLPTDRPVPTPAFSDWPALSDTELLERLRLPDARLAGHLAPRLAALAPRRHDAKLLERALGYPWPRPRHSYLLRGGEVELLSEADAGACEDRGVGAAYRASRLPLLAIGSNAAPETLAAKLEPLGERCREVLVLAGELHGFDIGPSAHLALYGAMPATLFESPGTAVRATVLWVEPAQLECLAQSELSYALGRLRARFAADGPAGQIDSLLAFVSRFGVFCPDGQPAALAAVPARNRLAQAFTQAQLLAIVADGMLGSGATPDDLLREACRDFAGLSRRLSRWVSTRSRPFTSAAYERYPA